MLEPAAVSAHALAEKRKVAATKARELEIPNRRTFKPVGESCTRIRFQRRQVSTHLYRSSPAVVLEFHCSAEVTITHRASRIVEAHERGDRHLGIRRLSDRGALLPGHQDVHQIFT
jgi:hypothetical protein